MNKNKKIILLLLLFVTILGVILYDYKSEKIIGKGKVVYENLSLFGNNMFHFSNVQKIKLGLADNEREYVLQFYEKKEGSQLELLEERRIVLPSRYVYIALEHEKPRIRIKFFNKKEKIDTEEFLLSMYRKQDDKEMEEGDTWEEEIFLGDWKETKNYLLYSWDMKYAKQEGLGYVIEQNGISELLNEDFQEANKILKAGNYIVLKEIS
ncbi:MAG: hypothetical protein Q4Q07_01530 [Tissierellia bacterium]|nr:hypothetical protein [Tissierellia bacterium]